MIVAITGANGQVGQSLQKIVAEFPSLQLHFFDSKTLDITDKSKIKTVFEDLCPDYIVNCAAYTAVDKAESEPKLAKLINETAVGYLADVALEVGATLVHYSSDYVYHNKSKKPLLETDIKSPKGIYAETKLAGEEAIEKSGCKSMMIRTSWVYSEYGHNFVKTMLRLAETKKQLSIVNDQIGCPTYATDLARATLQMIEQYPYLLDHQLVVNYAGAGQISWYDFAAEIFRQVNVDMLLAPVLTEDYPTAAKRPLWSVMDMSKIQDLFAMSNRPWEESLKECLRALT